MDTISVIVPCYKHARLLPQAIDSALNQTYPHVEIIVVDDGSPDDTREVAARYGSRIRYLWKENAGLSAARNTAILEAKGAWIHLLDADDYLAPDHLEKKMRAAAQHPDAAVLFGSWQEVDEENRFGAAVRAKELPGDAFHALFMPLNVGPPCRYTFRRAPLANAGLFDPDLKSCEDWDLWLRLAALGFEFRAVPDALAYYRNYPDSMSKNFERMWRSGLSVMRRNGRHHANCACCHRALSQGIRQWRRYCYLALLRSDLNLMAQNGQARAALSKAALAIRKDPAVAGYILKSFVATMGRRAGIGET